MDGTRVASSLLVGSCYRFLLLPLLLACLAALGMGDAYAGRKAPVRNKAAAPKSKAQVQKRANSSRLRPSTRAARLRSHKHGLRLKAKRGAPHQKSKAKTKTKLASKKAKRARTKTPKHSSAHTQNSQRKVKTSRAGTPSKFKSKVKPLAAAVAKTFARFKALPAVRGLARGYAKFSAATTRGLDRLQARAPPWLAKTMNNLRTYTVVSLAAFNLSYVKRDAKFLGTYFAATAVVSYAVLPGAIAFGLHPVTSTVLNVLTTPLAAAVLVFRDAQLKRRAGQPTTLAQSGRSILKDYKSFAAERRAAASARAVALSPVR